MAYLLDADVFIRAKNLHYGFDFCPAFWDWLVKENAAGNVLSIDKVEGEVVALGDDLSAWAQGKGSAFFVLMDPSVVASLGAVSAWANGPRADGKRYEPAAIGTFLQAADYYLVAHALAGKHVAVTHEVASSSQKKIKIPDACLGLGIKFMTPTRCFGASAPASCSGANHEPTHQRAIETHSRRRSKNSTSRARRACFVLASMRQPIEETSSLT